MKALKEKRAIAEKLKSFFIWYLLSKGLKSFLSKPFFIEVESVAQPQIEKSEVVLK